jgi:mannose-6-phosphate isomerase
MNYGGNKVNQIKIKSNSNHILSNDKSYYYEYLNNNNYKEYEYSNLKAACVYVISTDTHALIKFSDKSLKIKTGDCINIQNHKFKLCIKKGIVFVTGKKNNLSKKQSITKHTKSKLYKVKKPWGYELWLTGEKNKNYCFKKIFLKKGYKTSLQFHKKKKETNFLFTGKIKLHYIKSKSNKKNIKTDDIKFVTLKSACIMDVKPPAVHRIESINDSELFEVSTPHLDDVVRLHDDTNRSDGRILSEHKKN